MSLSPSILQAHPPTEAHNCQRMAVPSLPARLASPSRTDRPIHYRTDWPIHSRTDWPIHYRTDWPLHSGLTASLKQFLVSKSETENCFSEGSGPGPFCEFYIGFTIKKGLQRRRCTENTEAVYGFEK